MTTDVFMVGRTGVEGGYLTAGVASRGVRVGAVGGRAWLFLAGLTGSSCSSSPRASPNISPARARSVPRSRTLGGRLWCGYLGTGGLLLLATRIKWTENDRDRIVLTIGLIVPIA